MTFARCRTPIFCAAFMLLGADAAQACYLNCPPPPRPRMQSFQTKLVPPPQAGRLIAPNTAESKKNAKKTANSKTATSQQ